MGVNSLDAEKKTKRGKKFSVKEGVNGAGGGNTDVQGGI